MLPCWPLLLSGLSRSYVKTPQWQAWGKLGPSFHISVLRAAAARRQAEEGHDPEPDEVPTPRLVQLPLPMCVKARRRATDRDPLSSPKV